ncbi:MAG: UDP-galactopyranose mutase [bacterium]
MNGCRREVVVVGSGCFGATVAERLAVAGGHNVLVLEKRPHLGGNSFSVRDEASGVECHRYGSHIFHTDRGDVWAYVNRFSAFNHYRHRVIARQRGRAFFMPVSLATINAFFGLDLTPVEAADFLRREVAGESVETAGNFEEQAVAVMGRRLFEAFLRGYTRKQWGREPRELPAEMALRLPVRTSYHLDYFDDAHQGLPITGYGALFARMLDHPSIDVRLDTDYFSVRDSLPRNALVIYTGPIDRFFDYCHGRLAWRTLHFESELYPIADFQGTAVVNHVDEGVPYTRTHEFRHLHPERGHGDATVVYREFPGEAREGDEPYYPVLTAENKRILALYRLEADRTPRTIFGGRLGSYQYLDMDDAIAQALAVAEKIIQQPS